MSASGGKVSGEVDHDAVILGDVEDFKEGVAFGVADKTQWDTCAAPADQACMPERTGGCDDFHGTKAESDVTSGKCRQVEIAAIEVVSLLIEGLRVWLEASSLDTRGLVGTNEGLGGKGWSKEVVNMEWFRREEEVGNPLRTTDIDEGLEETGSIRAWWFLRGDERSELEDLRDRGQATVDFGHGWCGPD